MVVVLPAPLRPGSPPIDPVSDVGADVVAGVLRFSRIARTMPSGSAADCGDRLIVDFREVPLSAALGPDLRGGIEAGQGRGDDGSWRRI